MDAYVLGTHEGDLPTHLIGEGGNRIRAMARLDGPDHNAFFAIEVPDAESVEGHLDTIRAGGTNVVIVLIPNADLIGKVTHPSHIPPWERYLFLWLKREKIEDEIAAAVEILGADGVAAATAGEGLFLVELGGSDADALAQAAAIFGGTAHAVGVGGLTRG